ncbi:MAG TPA: hemolysin family protein [Acidobacteriota bacterium]|nr:hemolysin family protein [Acidobacteriota bacterium]
MSPFLLYIVLLIFFMMLAVYFSAAETAFMAVNRLRLKYQAEAGDKKAAAIKEILSNSDRLLGVILFGVTVAEIAASGIVTYVITSRTTSDHSQVVSLIASIIFSVVILIFCELTPKIIAAAYPDQMSRLLLQPIRITIRTLFPLARSASWIANHVVALLGLDPRVSPFTHGPSEDEIKAMIAGSSEASVPSEKKEMLHNIFEIGAIHVREVMIPRVEVTAIEINDDIPSVLDLVKKTNYSRFPVYRDNFENPVGILNVKDLLQYVQKTGDIHLQALLRPVQFVPNSAPVDFVLRQMQSMHLHMAIVVDEFGGVEGIVTLEDLIEEIVGEIRDEHDTEIEDIRELSPSLYAVAGKLPVKDFNRFFDEKIPEAPEYTTLAGFIEALTGRLLLEGETVQYQSLTFTMEKIERFKIVSIRVRTKPVASNG